MKLIKKSLTKVSNPNYLNSRIRHSFKTLVFFNRKKIPSIWTKDWFLKRDIQQLLWKRTISKYNNNHWKGKKSMLVLIKSPLQILQSLQPILPLLRVLYPMKILKFKHLQLATHFWHINYKPKQIVGRDKHQVLFSKIKSISKP